MKVIVKGVGPVDLGKGDFVAQGGEAAVYAKGNVAYKVYLDPKRTIPVAKIDELAAISDSAIVRPDRILLDPKDDKPIGYTMAFVQDTFPLVQSFTGSFRKREGLTETLVADLVLKARATVENVHRARCLIVDLNEWNLLLAKTFKRLFFLDADSYKTPTFPATALMDSVKDWKATSGARYIPTEVSDWFSFAVVTFQMFTGLHPFRGKYEGPEPEFRGKLPTDAVDDAFAVARRRMQHNISVFNKHVALPPAFSLSVIPKNWSAWYEAVFEKGDRCPPPPDLVAVAMMVPTVKVAAGTALTIEEVRMYDGPVADALGDDKLVVLTDKSVYSDGVKIGLVPAGCRGIMVSPLTGRVLLGRTGQAVTLWNATDGQDVPLGLNVDDLMSYDGRLYVRTRDKVVEVILHEMGGKVIAAPKLAANVLEHATRMFPGCIVQDMLGAMFVSMFPATGTTYQVHVKELDGVKLLAARFDRGVLMAVVRRKGGQYDRLVFRFNETYTAYDTRVVADVDASEPNFVVLDNGLIVTLTEEDEVEMASARMGSTTVTKVPDKALSGDMRLFRLRGRVGFWQGARICRMSKK